MTVQQVNLAEAAEALSIPKGNVLDDLKTGLADAISAVDTLNNFLGEYGKFIPGSSVITGPLAFLDKALHIAQSLLNYT